MMVCQTCHHAERKEIERALLLGVGSRALAGRYGMSKTSINRHRKCMGDILRRQEDGSGMTAKGVISRLVNRLERMADDVQGEGKRMLFLKTADRLSRAGEVFGKLNGEISSGSTNVLLMNLGVGSEAELRSAVALQRSSANPSLDEALEDGLALVAMVLRERPDARNAVLARLRRLALPSGAEVLGDGDGGESPPETATGPFPVNGGRHP